MSDQSTAQQSRTIALELEIDALIGFCNERIAPVDLPGAKLVVLKRTN